MEFGVRAVPVRVLEEWGQVGVLVPESKARASSVQKAMAQVLWARVQVEALALVASA